MDDSWTVYASTEDDGLVEIAYTPSESPVRVSPVMAEPFSAYQPTVEPRREENPSASIEADAAAHLPCCWGLYQLLLLAFQNNVRTTSCPT